jgi:acetylornithine deacetylase/succinyl-diaminopimelate desuccinylase-like protein
MTRALPAVALLLALPLSAAGQTTSTDPVATARAWREAHAPEILAGFAHLLSMPNNAHDAADIRANAEAVRDLLAARGVRADLWTLPGQAAGTDQAPPIVHGVLEVPGAKRTLGIYIHYDGQPVDASEWTSGPPYQAVLYTRAIEDGGTKRPLPRPGGSVDPEWRLYARSAGDDKAPIAAVLAALDALRGAGTPLTSNLVFFLEGEEEAGSPHLGAYMKAHRDALKVDAWLIFDGPVHPSRRPQLVFGVRGVTGLEITTYGATRYLHSGHYGNWAPNPALELASLLASMRTADGKVLIPRFEDSTVPPGEAERKAIAALPDFDGQLRRELGLAETEMNDAPRAERLLHPSLNIRGMVSGAVGETARNVIPTTATASLDVRLAEGNDPEHMLDLIERHIEAQGYHIVRQDPDLATRLEYPKIAKVIRETGYPAARTSPDLPIAREVIAAAGRAAGEPVIVLPTLGGSLPLYLFKDLLRAPVVIVPIANHDDKQHGPDENLRLANLWYGVDVMAALLTMP